MGWDLKDHQVPAPLPQIRWPAARSSTKSDCPGRYPTLPSTPPGTGHPWLLWAASANASPIMSPIWEVIGNLPLIVRSWWQLSYACQAEKILLVYLFPAKPVSTLILFMGKSMHQYLSMLWMTQETKAAWEQRTKVEERYKPKHWNHWMWRNL